MTPDELLSDDKVRSYSQYADSWVKANVLTIDRRDLQMLVNEVKRTRFAPHPPTSALVAGLREIAGDLSVKLPHRPIQRQKILDDDSALLSSAADALERAERNAEYAGEVFSIGTKAIYEDRDRLLVALADMWEGPHEDDFDTITKAMEGRTQSDIDAARERLALLGHGPKEGA